jgi:hypothetical protein
MYRTIVVGTCLGLSLASQASAAEVTSSSNDGQLAVTTVADDGVAVTRPSAFAAPVGLSMPAERLYAGLGYYPPYCLPMTSRTTYDLAHACFIRGLYEDAIAFANHGLTIRDDARLHLIKGVCLMHVGRCVEAEATVRRYLTAIDNKFVMGLANARERVNGPMRVRFEQIVEHIVLP